MEDWRRTARAVMRQTFTDNTRNNAAFQAINEARSHLALAADACFWFRWELWAHAGEVAPYLPTAMDRVGVAILCARRVSVSHAGSGHVFSLCTARLGLQDTAPATWHAWEGRHAQAANHAATALQSLHSAWSHGAAASDAVFVMYGMAPYRMTAAPLLEGEEQHAAYELLDHEYLVNLNNMLPWVEIPHAGLPLWDAWVHAAEQLLRRAVADLDMAQVALEQMRRAVFAEFFEAWWMLSGAANFRAAEFFCFCSSV